MGQWVSILRLAVELMVDASHEVEKRNRGVSNEDWLNDKAYEVVTAIRNNETLGQSGLILAEPVLTVDYRIPEEGLVRIARISVAYRKPR